MNMIKDKVVIITGASSGIGDAPPSSPPSMGCGVLAV